jgi:hypothetical protein
LSDQPPETAQDAADGGPPDPVHPVIEMWLRYHVAFRCMRAAEWTLPEAAAVIAALIAQNTDPVE